MQQNTCKASHSTLRRNMRWLKALPIVAVTVLVVLSVLVLFPALRLSATSSIPTPTSLRAASRKTTYALAEPQPTYAVYVPIVANEGVDTLIPRPKSTATPSLTSTL